jgi:hypothetical protein
MKTKRETAVTDRRYYYYRDMTIGNDGRPMAKPMVTVCVVKDSDGVYSRGIAICSLKDSPVKEEGRKIAYKRAMKAVASKGRSNRDKIVKIEEIVLDLCNADSFIDKCTYDACLTLMEEKIFNKPSAEEV